jgi:hypothetical protein
VRKEWGTTKITISLAGNLLPPTITSLGRYSRAPRWMTLLKDSEHDDRVLLIYADPHPIFRMESHKALQANKFPDSISELGRPTSLTLL